jgi:MFS family permease
MVTQVTGIVGPAIGGVLVVIWGIGGVFLLNGISFIVSGVSEFFISMPATERRGAPRKHIVAELGDGFSFVRNQPTILGILKTAAVLNFFTAPFAILLPIVARDYLGRGAEAFGFIMAALSVGFLAASAVLVAIRDVTRKHPFIILGISLTGGCLIAMGVTITYVSYITLMATIGVLLGLANILIMSYFQAVVPDELRGRVFGFMVTLANGLQPLAFGVVGILTDLLTAPVIFVVSGCALVVGGLYLYRVPGIRGV